MRISKEDEKIIKLCGFKKKWLSDKSGYWFEKKHKYKNFNIMFYCDNVVEYSYIVDIENKDKEFVNLMKFKSLKKFLNFERTFKIKI